MTRRLFYTLSCDICGRIIAQEDKRFGPNQKMWEGSVSPSWWGDFDACSECKTKLGIVLERFKIAEQFKRDFPNTVLPENLRGFE